MVVFFHAGLNIFKLKQIVHLLPITIWCHNHRRAYFAQDRVFVSVNFIWKNKIATNFRMFLLNKSQTPRWWPCFCSCTSYTPTQDPSAVLYKQQLSHSWNERCYIYVITVYPLVSSFSSSKWRYFFLFHKEINITLNILAKEDQLSGLIHYSEGRLKAFIATYKYWERLVKTEETTLSHLPSYIVAYTQDLPKLSKTWNSN